MSLARQTLVVTRPEVQPGLIAIPLRTPLVHPGDDLIAIVERATKGIARAGDVVTVAESAVAIAQGELIAAEHVRPSRLAYALARRAGALATMSQPESVQLVIDRVGKWRVIGATLAHAFGRLYGQRGAFYRAMGAAVAAFDGYTGTMPPYEGAIVFSPKDPDGFARRFSEQTGIACAVVDANDLGRAQVLGACKDVCRETVAAALLDNPGGNSDEQTPVVVLKWRGRGPNPLIGGDS